MFIHQFLEHSAQAWPQQIAVEEETGRTITYQALAALSDRLCDRLRHMGVCRGDRVGLYLPKSIDAVAAIFGVLKAGAAYVPVDPGAPAARNAYILNDCGVRVLVAERSLAEKLRAEIAASAAGPHLLLLDGVAGGRALRLALDELDQNDPAPAAVTEPVQADDLAYILYTSGSTGKPKGVMLSQLNASSFVDWCSELFQPNASDRFSSHAPFHFDLSILDLFLCLKHGATLILIGTELGKEPARLAAFIAEKRITSWYSTPSILSLLTQYGKLAQHDYSAVRLVLFAGEVFPIKHLKALRQILPAPRYFNLYGPTETNVCTYYEIPRHIPEEQNRPYPIGKICSHLESMVVDESGRPVIAGQEGELCIRGSGVMQGYWNLPERTATAFLVDIGNQRWYKTGDIVLEAVDGNYIYVGRRDRMIKKRGYRVELGEIEAGLYRHPAVKEAAVVALADEDQGVRVKAYLSCKEGETRPSLVELKRFCAENLPVYMVPDLFAFQEALPKTSTDKIDYRKLQELSA